MRRHFKLLMVPFSQEARVADLLDRIQILWFGSKDLVISFNMKTSLPLDRRAALKLGLGTSIGSLLGLASARAEDRPGNQQPSGTNLNMGPRTDPPPLVDARFP